MSKLAALIGSNGGLVAGAAVVAVAAVGAGFYVNTLGSDAPVAPAEQQVAAVPETAAPQTDPKPTPEAKPVPADNVAQAADVAPAPSIDEVRVEADGLAVIAGRAVPGSKVTVLLDGVANTEVMADATGGFAAVTTIAPNSDAQVLTILQRVEDSEVASLDEVIVAPVARPEPKPKPKPQAEIARVEPDAPAPQVDEPETPSPAVTEDPLPAEDAPATEVADAEPSAPAPEQPETTEPVAEAAQARSETVPAADPAPETPPVAVAQAETSAPAPQIAPKTPAPAEQPAPDTQVATAEQTQAPAILKSTEEGVEVLSNTRPEALENIEIDTI